MGNSRLGKALGQLHKLTGPAAFDAMTDRQLLDRFLTLEDERAFEVLVRRHGPAVLGLCRRVLDGGPDADDAFQATFVVLALKAASIRSRDSVGAWLHGVACRVARRARTVAHRRRARHGPLCPDLADPRPAPDCDDLRLVLDEELERLPDKYRAPLVLCYLQGKTNEQAAHELGWPPGSMSRRLARARELLRGRLVRRGVTLSLTALSGVLSADALAVTVPAALTVDAVRAGLLAAAGAATAGAVAGLVKGVMQTMLFTKLKIASLIVLAVGLLGTGAGLMIHRAFAADPAPQVQTGGAPTPQKEPVIQVPQPAKGKEQPARQQPEKGQAVAYSPDGKLVAWASPNVLQLVDAATAKIVRRLGDGQTGAVSVRFSPDGRWLVTAGSKNGSVRLWDVATGKEIRRFQGHQGGATGATLSPDGRVLVSAGKDKVVALWDTSTGREIARMSGHQMGVTAVAYSPDGRVIASADSAGVVCLWDAQGGQLFAKSQGNGGQVAALAFAPDGQTVAAGEANGTIRVLDAPKGTTSMVFKGPKGAILGLSYAPDGKRLAAAGGTELRVWDVAQGAAAEIPGKHRGLRAVAFSPDGRKLAYVGEDGLHFWDVVRGQPPQP